MSPVLNALDLGPKGVRYYAGSVFKSRISQLQQRDDADRHLHIIAFIAHQHHRLQDALVDMLLSVVQSFETAAGRDHKDQVFDRRKTESARLEGLLDAIDTQVVGALQEIENLVENKQLSDIQKLDRIKAVLARNQKRKLSDLRADIHKGIAEDEHYHQILERRSLRLQNRLNPILRAVAFEGDARAADLMTAIVHFREKDGTINATAPLGFLTSDERKAISAGTGAFRVSLYKAFLFRHVAGAIKAGNLNLEGSYKYRPLDDYLISRERWNRDKSLLLDRAGLAELVDPEPLLRALDEALHQQYGVTNAAAYDNANPHLKIAANGDFRVATPALEDVESEPLRQTLPQRHYVPVTGDPGDRQSPLRRSRRVPALAAGSCPSTAHPRGYVRWNHGAGLRNRHTEDGPDLSRCH